MKLKRFLLRYEPPGIGLELESKETGALHTKHYNFPPAGEVTSLQDVSALTDELIEAFDFLTRKKHRRALMLLIGRLYQIEVDDRSDDEVDDGSPTATAVFKPGLTVVLVGLTGKMQVHNGELGSLLKVKEDKGKFEIQLLSARSGTPDQSEPLKVRGQEHIIPVAKNSSLNVGTHVAIRGLRNHVELNGCLGRIVERHEEMHRFEVRATESGQLFRVKQENLVPIDVTGISVGSGSIASKENREPNLNSNTGYSQKQANHEHGASPTFPTSSDGAEEIFDVGSVVQLMGLRSAMVYNGQTAEVLSVDRSRCRYEIRLSDGSVKTIRAENVRLASPSSRRQHTSQGVPA